MKNYTSPLLFILLTLASVSKSYSIIWRANSNSNYNGTSTFGENLGGTASNPVFSSMLDVMNSSKVGLHRGDSIYFEGSNNPYSGGTNITKRVTILGAGYFLTENAGGSANGLSTIFNSSFSINADSVTIAGISFSTSGTIVVNGSYILIERCRFNGNININSRMPVGFSNIIIQRNFIDNNSTVSTATSSGGLPSNIYINNNFISGKVDINSLVTITQFNNNIFTASGLAGIAAISVFCQEFRNNILKNANVTVAVSSTNISHNISAGPNQFGFANNNIELNPSQQSTSLFVPAAGASTDGKYKLQSSFVSGNLGYDGTQRGIFGGSTPYVLSGVTQLPVIYSMDVPNFVSQQDSVNIHVKSRVTK